MLYLKYEVENGGANAKKSFVWHPCVAAMVLERGRGWVKVWARYFDGCPPSEMVLKDRDFGDDGSDDAWTFMVETSATGTTWFAAVAWFSAIALAILTFAVALWSAHPDIVEPYVKRLLTRDETW